MRELRGSSIDVKSMHDDEFARREKKRIKSAREGGRESLESGECGEKCCELKVDAKFNAMIWWRGSAKERESRVVIFNQCRTEQTQ